MISWQFSRIRTHIDRLAVADRPAGTLTCAGSRSLWTLSTMPAAAVSRASPATPGLAQAPGFAFSRAVWALGKTRRHISLTRLLAVIHRRTLRISVCPRPWSGWERISAWRVPCCREGASRGRELAGT